MSELETVVSGEAAEGGAVERGYVSGGEGDSAQVQDHPSPADFKGDDQDRDDQEQDDQGDQDSQHQDNQDQDSQHQGDQDQDSQHQDDQDQDDQHQDGQHQDSQHQDSQHQDSQHQDDQHQDGQHQDDQHQDDQHQDDQHQDDQDQDDQHQDGQHQDSQHQDGQLQDSQHQDDQHQDGQHQDSQHQDDQHQDGQHQDDQHQDGQLQDSQHQDSQHRDNQDGQRQDDQRQDGQRQDNQDQDNQHRDNQDDQRRDDQDGQRQDNQDQDNDDNDQSDDSESGSYGTPAEDKEDETYRTGRRRRRGSEDSEEGESEEEGKEKSDLGRSASGEEEAGEEGEDDGWGEEKGEGASGEEKGAEVVEDKQSQEDGWEESSTREKDEPPKDSPMFVPMKGKFFQHDDRFQPGEEEEEAQLPVEPRSKADAVDRWEHDLFVEVEQGPRQSWEKDRDERVMQAMERRKREGEGSGRGGMQLGDFVRRGDRDRFDSRRGQRDRGSNPRRGREDRDRMQERDSWRPQRSQDDDWYQREGSGRGSRERGRGSRGRGSGSRGRGSGFSDQPGREGGDWTQERQPKWPSDTLQWQRQQEKGWESQSGTQRQQEQTRNDQDRPKNQRGRQQERNPKNDLVAEEQEETARQDSSTFVPATTTEWPDHQSDTEKDVGRIESMVVTANGVEIKSPPVSGKTTRREERSPRTLFHIGGSTEPKSRQTKVFSLSKESGLVIKSEERKPKGRGRGWREKLVAPKVGALQSDITVIEPLEKRLPSEQTEDSQIESVSINPGLPCVKKTDDTAEPPESEDHDQIQPPEPTEPVHETATDEVQDEVPPISQPAPVSQVTKPKRYSSQRQALKTVASEEEQERRQQGKEEAPTQWPSFMDPTHYQEAFAQQLKMMHLPQNDPTMDATIQAMLYQNPALHQHLQYMWLQQQQQQQTMMRMHQEYVNRAMPMAPVEMMNYPQQPIAPVEHEGLPAPPQFPFLFIPPLAPEDQRQQQFQPPSQKPRSQAIPIVPPKGGN